MVTWAQGIDVRVLPSERRQRFLLKDLDPVVRGIRHERASIPGDANAFRASKPSGFRHRITIGFLSDYRPHRDDEAIGGYHHDSVIVRVRYVDITVCRD